MVKPRDFLCVVVFSSKLKGWALTAQIWLLFLRTFSLFIMRGLSFVKPYYLFGSLCNIGWWHYEFWVNLLWGDRKTGVTDRTNMYTVHRLKAACGLFIKMSALKVCCSYTLPTATDGVWSSLYKTPLATASKLIIKWKKAIHTRIHFPDLHTTFKTDRRPEAHKSCNPCLLGLCCFSPTSWGVYMIGSTSIPDRGAQLLFRCATQVVAVEMDVEA